MWRQPRDNEGLATRWRELLSFMSERAEEVRFSLYVTGRSQLELQWSLPPLRLRRGATGEEIVAALEKEFEPALSIDRSRHRWGYDQRFDSIHVTFALSPVVRQYLLETARYPEGWDQYQDLPEDPTLLANGQVLLETISQDGEVFLEPTEEEVAELRGRGFDFIGREAGGREAGGVGG